MIVIGLTGGIGSGKSTVSDYLREKNFYIIDADRMAHEMTQKGSQCLDHLVKAFGEEILTDTGELNRKKLGAIVFDNKEKKERLEELTTHVIVKNIEDEVSQLRKSEKYDIIFLDVPLLFETGMNRICDAVALVTADEDVRIERVVQRDGISPEQVKLRINNQMSTEEKTKGSTDIIDNSKGKEELYHNIEQLLAKYAGTK